MVCLFISLSVLAADVTIYAAASTTNAVNEIMKSFEAETGKTVTASFASSGTLAKQIDNSAPADIFISANIKWMDWLSEKGKIETDTRIPYLANNLALIAPVSSSAFADKLDAETVKALIGSGKFAMGDPEHVPAGMYSQKTLESLGLWESLQGQAARMQDVRATLAMVERNAVPFGMVYSSDASISDKVKTIALFDENLHGPIRYPMAVIKDKKTDAVMSFYNYLKTEKSANIFAKYGFSVVK
jgi:molybdate transport system substrate-binding protein